LPRTVTSAVVLKIEARGTHPKKYPPSVITQLF